MGLVVSAWSVFKPTSETSPRNGNMKLPTLYGLIAPILLTLQADAEKLSQHIICATNPPDFIHLTYDAANAAVQSEDQLIVGRKAKKISSEYITNLVNQLRYGHLSNDNKTLALYFLGSLRPRDTNSIELLIDNIDFKATKFDPNLGPAAWGFYPAQEALMKIGSPVANPILGHLATESGDFRRRLMCEVLQRIGAKQTSQNQIKAKLVAEPDSTKHGNLEAALKDLEK